VPGAAIGAAIVAAITSGLVFFNVDPLWGSVVTGVVILLAIGSDGIIRNRLVGAVSRRRGATG
jgi:ribose/xylose/arabinose/galactoside ABC-type transport system permease subunit